MKNFKEATMQEILDAREKRVVHQKKLLDKFKKPLICFTMNIPGPVKNSSTIIRGFQLGLNLLKAQLSATHIPILYHEECYESTGCEGYYVVKETPEMLKQICIEIEDVLPVGRLFDLDVLCPDSSKMSRKDLGFPERSCMLCDQPAYICSRNRTHSLSLLQQHVQQLLENALLEQDARQIGTLAAESLLYEVCITPKPGLVDCRNSGSHQDMNLFTFLASASALQPYFTDCATVGFQTASLSPIETFQKICFLGKNAEQTMYKATHGVNTHKGAIFSLGILCAATARLEKSKRTPESVCMQAALMTQELSMQNIHSASRPTIGQQLFKKYGISGARGQAKAGFPDVLGIGLPTLKHGLESGLSINDAGAATLLALLCVTEDTNLISRSDFDTLKKLQQDLDILLSQTPYPDKLILEQLDNVFIQKNLSPGGSADLLAVTFFLYFLQKG